jgi:integrase
MARITTLALRSPWRGQERWLSDGGGWGAGRLMARILQDSIGFHYRYYAPDRRKRFLPLGPYDASGERGLTLPAARDRAAELSALYRSGVHDLHGHFERLRIQESQAHVAAQKAEADAREAAQHGTLDQLLSTYTDHLARLGKSSVKDVRNIFKNHMLTGHAALVSRKANAVGVDEFVEVIGQVVAAGHGRTAAKLRSYLRAAYALAIEAKTDPAAPALLKTFGISTNPLASIGALSQFNRTRHRHLAVPELSALLQRVDRAPASAQTDALEVAIALGGQRPTQLLRLRAGDVDLAGGTITLYDPKGARDEPRVHVIPLPPRAVAILARRLDALSGGGNAAVFSTDGVTPMRLETVSVCVSALSQAMVEDHESREPFQLRDLRRTLETLLASLGVSRDVRGQVQSHGLGGVQNRHYDRHEYLAEKRATLTLLEAQLARLRAAEAAAAHAAPAPAAPSPPAEPTAPAKRPDWAILRSLDLAP